MKDDSDGFSLMELIVAICIVGLLAAIAIPIFANWSHDAQYRAAARNIASIFREARARAIATNLEHRVEFHLGEDRYRLTHGNRPAKSTDSSWSNNIVYNWRQFPEFVDIKANEECDKDDLNINVEFNPNGTGSSRYFCVMDEHGKRRFRAGVSSTTTGRVLVQGWNDMAEQWQ